MMRWLRRPRTQNAAILLSDMKGFTARTSRQTREENARMLALHDALLLPVMRGYGGRKVKSIGDALLMTFVSPTDAVLCAMAMQDRLAQFNGPREPGEQIEVRTALSLGEVRLEAGDVHGEPVQLALEACARADAGEVLLTDAVYLAMNKREVPTERCGSLPLRGGGELRLHKASRGDDPRAPFAGRALLPLRLSPPRDPRNVRRAALGAALLLLAGVSAAAVQLHRSRDPVLRAEELLAAREPLAALAELDKVADLPEAREPRVAALRAKAENELGQFAMAFADFSWAGPSALDDAALRALADELDAESFPRAYRPALVRFLGERVGVRAAPAVRALLGSARGEARRGALEVLELCGASTPADRLQVARADLADRHSPCKARIQAVARLAVSPDQGARGLLEASARGSLCGAAQARDALRRLARN